MEQGLISRESRIVFVNDGSSDKTWSIIQELHRTEPQFFSGIDLAHNSGHQNAVLAGLMTVKDICERAHVSRKTFYANFRDKEDIVSYVFKRDVIQPLHHINAVFTLEEAKGMTATIQTKIYQPIYDDREYYRNLVVSMKGHDDTFIRVATSAIYEFDREVLERIGFKGEDQHADYISYFYASSQAMLMQKWIFDNFSLSVDELSRLYSSMTLEFWKTVADYM
jgi:AcrR family transcriptional regulator